jgi:hypothetical protein
MKYAHYSYIVPRLARQIIAICDISILFAGTMPGCGKV